MGLTLSQVFSLRFPELHKETKQKRHPKFCVLSLKKTLKSIRLTVFELQRPYLEQNLVGESPVTFTKMRCGT